MNRIITILFNGNYITFVGSEDDETYIGNLIDEARKNNAEVVKLQAGDELRATFETKSVIGLYSRRYVKSPQEEILECVKKVTDGNMPGDEWKNND